MYVPNNPLPKYVPAKTKTIKIIKESEVKRRKG